MSPRILIADDDPEVRDLLVSILRQRNYEPHAVEDGERACSYLERRQADGDLPDLVLTDLGMPCRDGNSLVRFLSITAPAIPVLVLTGQSDPNLRDQALEAGAFAVLHKPAKPDQLIEAIESALAGHRPTNLINALG